MRCDRWLGPRNGSSSEASPNACPESSEPLHPRPRLWMLFSDCRRAPTSNATPTSYFLFDGNRLVCWPSCNNIRNAATIGPLANAHFIHTLLPCKGAVHLISPARMHASCLWGMVTFLFFLFPFCIVMDWSVSGSFYFSLPGLFSQRTTFFFMSFCTWLLTLFLSLLDFRDCLANLSAYLDGLFATHSQVGATHCAELSATA